MSAIDVVITNGKDVFDVTSLGRHTTARQQVVMDLLNILLEPGAGKRSMHPPGHQWWTETGDAPPGDPPDSAAA